MKKYFKGKSLSKRTIAIVFIAVCCIAAVSFKEPIKAFAPNIFVDNINQNKDVKWHSIIFGVSTSKENNTITLDDANKTVTINAGSKDGSKTGGKITGSNDGMSYYYTEIDPYQNFELSASVKVNYFEKKSPDNQAGFGIMARDVLGIKDDASLSPSNVVLVGGYKGKVESVFRNGVTKDLSDKIVMEGEYEFSKRPPNDGTATYRLSLKKTNTGYIACVDDGEAQTYYRPKQLEVLDSKKIYVGFFAARVASIAVSDIDFKTTNASSDPNGVPEPEKVVKPSINIVSSNISSKSKYELNLKATINGNVNIKQGDKVIYDGKIENNTPLKIHTIIEKGDNAFNIKYTPNKEVGNTNIDPIEEVHNVTFKNYGVPNGDIYVAPNGKADGKGTKEDPIDIYSATNYTNDGQTIKIKGGIYNLTSPIVIDKNNSGIQDKVKTLTSYDNERAIFDFGKVSNGLSLQGDYWKIYGIDVINTKDKTHGITVAGNNNVVERVKTYKNGDTGLQISGDLNDIKENWPKNNLILNCDSYDNMDAAMNNADGFAAKISSGEGNVFRGCISHNNCDDGWDLFTKLENGTIGAITIEDCIAYGNGTLSDGTVTKGDGNGFKLGGEGISVKNVLKNSLAFNNNATGITGNSNPAISVENSKSADNKKANYGLDYYTNAKFDYSLTNNISIRTKDGEKDSVPDMVLSDDNYFYDGTSSKNKSGVEFKTSRFISIQIPNVVERDNEGNIALGDYMKE
ncbi:pectate disaccharide-lyase precursor [Clostridium puniceum]|uniref:Pectate disaccharide-lyase n=1 Tax=Clostridium puniceum TaxID=29367 RepID=A0A1S8TCA9_9CLOT|nr:right-handed parallel beta-helix repeat-containing protein [Clostridium puniceum]OOM75378.1 pectate disaccharide-lyase precursor [Clostridium puniceum]